MSSARQGFTIRQLAQRRSSVDQALFQVNQEQPGDHDHRDVDAERAAIRVACSHSAIARLMPTADAAGIKMSAIRGPAITLRR